KYLIQRNIVSQIELKALFSQLAIHLSKNRRRSSAAKMLYASFASFCQQLFSKFFQKGVSAPRSSLPRGAFSEPLCLSAFVVMPKTRPAVKHFFHKILKYLNFLAQPIILSHFNL
ncbi:MAG: hypothetical protein IJE96_02500, partial [Mailhella sp.]|nr:hypothetical protein [Mailhella sp.]